MSSDFLKTGHLLATFEHLQEDTSELHTYTSALRVPESKGSTAYY